MPVKYDSRRVVKPGVEYQWTKEMAIEYAKCAKSVEYFAFNQCKVVHPVQGVMQLQPRDYQRRMLDVVDKHRLTVLNCPRQIGKSTIIGLYALWLTIFADKDKPAEVWVLSNKAASAQSFLDDIKGTYEELEPYLKCGMAEYNKTSIEFENGSSIKTGATSKDTIRGESPSFLILDEFAHVAPHKAEEFYTAILPTISCIVGDSLILTSEGYSKIEKFSPKGSSVGDYLEIEGLKVYGENGLEEVSHYYNSPESETRKVTTEYGFVIESTLKHPVKILNDDGFFMVNTNDIKVGDFVVVHEGMNVFGRNRHVEINYTKIYNQSRSEKVSEVIEITDDIAYMIGGYLAEGWMVKNGKKIMYISNNDDDFRNIFLRNGFKVVNDGRMYANTRWFEIFKEVLGCVWDKKCYEKEIPSFVLGASENIQKKVIAGYIDGDGCVLEDGSVVIVSTSQKMLSQIQLMLVNMGIISRIHEIAVDRTQIGTRLMPQGKVLKSLRRSYHLTIPRSYSPRIKKEFRLEIKRKQARLLDYLKSERDGEKQKKITFTKWMFEGVNSFLGDKVITKNKLRRVYGVRVERWKIGQTIKMETFRRMMVAMEDNLTKEEIQNNKYKINDLLELNKKCIYLEVCKIEKSFNKTYDLTCPKTHTFLQNGILGSNTGGRMCIISTPNGNRGKFYELFNEAKNGVKEGDGEGDFWHFDMAWNEPPGRTEQFKKSQIKASSVQEWTQEYEAKFLGSSSTLITGECLEKIGKFKEEPLHEIKELRVWEKPSRKHCYAISCDVAKGVEKDNSVMQIFDVTSKDTARQVAIWVSNLYDPYDFSEKIVEIAKMYNNAYVVIENNTYGHEVCRRIWNEFEYTNLYKEPKAKTFGVNANKRNKSIGTSLLKKMMESDRLYVRDEYTYDELCGFIEVNPDIYRCDNGKNSRDDRVMALVWLAYLLSSDYWDDWGDYFRKEAAGIVDDDENDEEIQKKVDEYDFVDVDNIYDDDDDIDDVDWLLD